MNVIDGVKVLKSLSSAIATGTMAAMGGAALSVTGLIKKTIDKNNQELLEATEQSEGCPHISMIDGWTQPFNDMLSHLNKFGGIAWQSGDGNGLWYYHEEDTFRPFKFLAAYYTKALKKVDSGDAGKVGCSKCAALASRRSNLGN